MKIQPLNLLSAQPAARTYALLSVGAALITIILKFTAYLLTGSVGLLSDALESVVNLSGFAALAASYPAGWLVDRYSRTAVIIPGGLGMVGALALFAARQLPPVSGGGRASRPREWPGRASAGR